MNIKQTCKHCDEEMKLTEITTDTGRKVWAYMCSCNEMVREAKEARRRSNGVANNVINPTAPQELFERYYDNPVDNDGNQKPNKSLGNFEIIENIESDFYNSMRIAKSADNKIYLVIEREVFGYNGGTRLRILEIKNVQHITTAST